MNPLLLPVIAIQGAWVRRKMAVLPEAQGNTTGTVQRPLGTPLRLVVLGESTAAGCGAQTHDEAFTGAFARALAKRENRCVQWHTLGRNGASLRRVRYRILPDFDDGADLAVLLIGVNDVLSRTSPEQWRQDLSAVLDLLTAQAKHVIVAGIPGFDEFPALPRALGNYLSEHARALDNVSQELCSARPQTRWISSKNLSGAGARFFASDGFHPSAAGYERWAQTMSDRLV